MVSVRGTRERTQWLERVAGNTTPHTYAPALGPLCEGATSCGVSVAREGWKVEARVLREKFELRMRTARRRGGASCGRDERCEAHLDTTGDCRKVCVQREGAAA